MESTDRNAIAGRIPAARSSTASFQKHGAASRSIAIITEDGVTHTSNDFHATDPMQVNEMTIKISQAPLPILNSTSAESRTIDDIRDDLIERRRELTALARLSDGPGRLATLYAQTLTRAYRLSRPLDGTTILASPAAIIELILSLEFGVVTNLQM